MQRWWGLLKGRWGGWNHEDLSKEREMPFKGESTLGEHGLLLSQRDWEIARLHSGVGWNTVCASTSNSLEHPRQVVRMLDGNLGVGDGTESSQGHGLELMKAVFIQEAECVGRGRVPQVVEEALC